MAWYKVAEAGSLEALAAKVPQKYEYIPAGKRTRIIINTSPFPIAPIFDLAGAELAAKLMNVDGKLIDVYGNGAFEAVFEVEAMATTMSSPDEASMAMPQVVLWIGVIAGVLVLLPLVTRLASLFANFIPSGGDGTGGGIWDYLKSLFGDYTPYVLVGGAVILFLLLKGKSGGGQAPVIYNIPSGRRGESED